MKKTLLLFIISLGLFAFKVEFGSKEKSPKIKFKHLIVERKDIEYNKDREFLFPFKNIGKDTLWVNVQSSYGCVICYGPREPILPGKKNVIKVIYDTKRVGPFQKTVTVTTNDPLNSQIILTIKGNVLPQEENDQTEKMK
jgi:hypothetical protein